MSSDPKSNVSQNSLSDVLDKEIDRLLALGLENFSVRELLGMLVSAAGQAERRAYLAEASGDKGNGGYDRSLNVGSIPVDVQVPRTRSGNFRPRTLPPPYQRGYSDELQALLLGLLGSSRSLNAAKNALKKMGLGSCAEELDSVASGMVEELELVKHSTRRPGPARHLPRWQARRGQGCRPAPRRLRLPRRRSSSRREKESPRLLHSIRP